MGKTLIIYYSFEGHTDKVAHLFKTYLNADIKRIEPVHERTQKGFGKYFWGGAMVVMRKEPELKPFDMDDQIYDTIWIGSPVWAWTITPPILTLLKSDLIQNKNIVFFYTHDGGPGQVEKRFLSLLHPSNRMIGAIGFESIDKMKDPLASKCEEFIKTLPLSLQNNT
jgi:flavodoxin